MKSTFNIFRKTLHKSVKARSAFTTPSEKRRANLFAWRSSAGGAKPGFTLIETFVATSVLLVSLAGPLSIAAQALRTAYYARDEVTAFYLAQEALEYIQAKRDQNYLAGANWINGLDNCTSALGCTVDFPNFTDNICQISGCLALSIRSSDNLFVGPGSGSTSSMFTRSVFMSTVNPNEEEVKVTISWASAGIPRSFTLSEHLFNWF